MNGQKALIEAFERYRAATDVLKLASQLVVVRAKELAVARVAVGPLPADLADRVAAGLAEFGGADGGPRG